MDADVLELQTRRRVYDAVRTQPGIHGSEVAREAGLGNTHARYHLAQLVRAHLVVEQADEGFVRYYPLVRTRGVEHSALSRQETQIVQALRRPRALHIATALAVHGPMPLSRIAAHVGKSPPAVSFQLNGLVERGVVLRLGATPAERVYALADAAEVQRVLTLYPPRPGVVASFMALWEGFALPAPLRDAASPPGGPAGWATHAPEGAPPEGRPKPRTRLAALLRGILAAVGRGSEAISLARPKLQ